jgi:hypothetical protein
MVKKVIVLQILVILLFTGCSFENKRVAVNLRVPEALVVTTSETVNKIKKLQEQNTVEANKLVEKIFNERTVIDDEQTIKKVFNEINKLQGVITNTSDIINGNFLFSFDLIDDKEKGLDGNDYSEDLRYIAVVREDTIVIPMLYGADEASLNEKSPYFIKAKINKEFYELLRALAEAP